MIEDIKKSQEEYRNCLSDFIDQNLNNEKNFMTIHIKINDENVMTQNEVITIVFESLYRSMSLESVFILVSIYIATV